MNAEGDVYESEQAFQFTACWIKATDCHNAIWKLKTYWTEPGFFK